MEHKKSKVNMQLIDFSEDRPKRKKIAGGQRTGKKAERKLHTASEKTTSRNTKGTRRKKELQLIGERPNSSQKKKVIRADVVTNLDIIGEEENTCIREYQRTQIRLDEKKKRRKKKRKRAIIRRVILASGIIIMMFLIGLLVRAIGGIVTTDNPMDVIEDIFQEKKKVNQPEIVENFLDLNEYSRPGEVLGKVKNIFVHYTANPGTTAEQNRSYFQGLAVSGERSASAHFIIGYDGEIIQCIPLDEIGCAVIEHNYNSVSIECCYQDEDGHFTQATYESLLHLTTWLMGKYNLTADDILRHYDAGGKLCPKYYVEHPEAWNTFKVDLENYVEKCGKN